MESCNKQKSVKQIKIDFRFYKVVTLSLPWWPLCTLLAFSQTASWDSHRECFSNSLEGVPTYAEHLLDVITSLHVPNHPKSQLGWGQVIVEARLSNAALHHSPSWSNSSYTAWRCVLGRYPVEKVMIVPLSANKMGWRIAMLLAMLVKCALNSK
jgi:hypothetical protein